MEEEVTLVRLVLDGKKLFVRTEWHGNSFILEVTDGTHAWVCDVPPEEVEKRAAGWVVPVAEYMEVARRYFVQQVKGSGYDFAHGPRDGQKKLTWTTYRAGDEVHVHWILHPAKKPGEVILGILDMLADENEELKDTVERKTRAFERASAEATKALDQSDRFQTEKNNIQDDLYRKFVAVLNAKKAKIRQLKEAVETGGFASNSTMKALALGDGYHSPPEDEPDEEEDSESERDGSRSEQRNKDGGHGQGLNLQDTGGAETKDPSGKGKGPLVEGGGREEAGPSGERERGAGSPLKDVKREDEEVDVKPNVRELFRVGGSGLSKPSDSVVGQGGGPVGGGGGGELHYEGSGVFVRGGSLHKRSEKKEAVEGGGVEKRISSW